MTWLHKVERYHLLTCGCIPVCNSRGVSYSILCSTIQCTLSGASQGPYRDHGLLQSQIMLLGKGSFWLALKMQPPLKNKNHSKYLWEGCSRCTSRAGRGCSSLLSFKFTKGLNSLRRIQKEVTYDQFNQGN